MIHKVRNLAEFNDILKEAGDKLAVVYFTAIWCGPWLMIAPVFQNLSDQPEYENVIFLQVDMQDAPDMFGVCKISSMPIFQFYKHGIKVTEFFGADINMLTMTLRQQSK